MANVIRECVEGIGISSNIPPVLGDPTATPIVPGYFTEICIPEFVKIPDVKPNIEQLLSVMVDASIVSVRIIDSPIGTSEEGQHVSGKKLSLELKLRQKVKYIADEPTQSVHAAHFEHLVSSILIVVPETIPVGTPPVQVKIETLLMQGKVNITPYIEDIYAEQLDKRNIFKNITVLINVTINTN